MQAGLSHTQRQRLLQLLLSSGTLLVLGSPVRSLSAVDEKGA